MIVAYDSLTGNVERFIKKVEAKFSEMNEPFQSLRVSEHLHIGAPFILVTYTIGFGRVPLSTKQFLRDNHPYLFGVASSGNRNWGANFAKSAITIAEHFGVKMIAQFELAGTNEDVETFIRESVGCETHRVERRIRGEKTGWDGGRSTGIGVRQESR